MSKRLYLCRHGQTVFNIKGIAQGRCDSPLTDDGIKQALEAKAYFINNNIKYDGIYCSPLGRAKETCKIITGVDGVCVDGLIEMNFGEVDGESYLKCRPYHDDFTSIGGENRDIAGDRMYKTLSELMEQNNGDVLAVSHATVGRCFYYKVVGAYDPNYKVPNCGIAIYDYDDGKFKFKRLVNPND